MSAHCDKNSEITNDVAPQKDTLLKNSTHGRECPPLPSFPKVGNINCKHQFNKCAAINNFQTSNFQHKQYLFVAKSISCIVNRCNN